jgi:hypothetical protein
MAQKTVKIDPKQISAIAAYVRQSTNIAPPSKRITPIDMGKTPYGPAQPASRPAAPVRPSTPATPPRPRPQSFIPKAVLRPALAQRPIGLRGPAADRARVKATPSQPAAQALQTAPQLGSTPYVQQNAAQTQWAPQGPSSGLGAPYDSVAATGLDQAAQQRAALAQLAGQAGASSTQYQQALVAPRQGDYMSAYDDEQKRFLADYEARKADGAALFNQGNDQLHANLQAILDRYAAGNQAEVGRISNGATAASANIGAVTGEANSLPPEVRAAIATSANRSVANQSAAMTNASADKALQATIAAQSDFNGVLGQYFGAEQGNRNDLLKIGGGNMANLLAGRTDAQAKFNDANAQYAKTGAGIAFDGIDTQRKLDDTANDPTVLKQMLLDIASAGRNDADNSTSILNNNADNATSTANYALGQAGSDRRQVAAALAAYDRAILSGDMAAARAASAQVAAAERNSATIAAAADRQTARLANTPAGRQSTVKGDAYLQTLGAKPAARDATLAFISNGTAASKSKEHRGENPMALALELVDRQTQKGKVVVGGKALDAAAVKQHIRNYYGGVQVATSSKGAVTAASAGFRAAKASGYRVDGLGATSAAHDKTNPQSDHRTSKAFDIHAKGPEALAYALAIPGARYVIHNSTMYTRRGSEWTSKPYGGKFANGQAKDPHKAHIHVNF